MTNTYKSTYKTHAKRGLCRFIAGNGPEPKTTGVGDTDCKQKFEDQHVTLDVEKVDCLKCLAKLATASETRRKKAVRCENCNVIFENESAYLAHDCPDSPAGDAVHEPADDFEPATDADGFAPDQFAAGDAIANDAELEAAIPDDWTDRDKAAARKYGICPECHLIKNGDGDHVCDAAGWNAAGVPVADFVVIDVPKEDPPATTPEPAPEALIGRVSLEDWQLGLISDQINQRIGNLAGITNLIIEHDDAPAGGDMDLLFHLGQAVDSLEKANAIVRAERDARFSYLVEVAKENAIDAEEEPIFCNSKSKEQLDEIISGVGACLTRPGGVFATIAGREPQKYISTVQDDGQVLIQFAQPINEKLIQRIAAKPFGVEFARAMFSETIPQIVKEEIRRRSGRSWPRFNNSGQPIGQVHPDEFRRAAEEMFDSDFCEPKF